jgi:hypothetical protein
MTVFGCRHGRAYYEVFQESLTGGDTLAAAGTLVVSDELADRLIFSDVFKKTPKFLAFYKVLFFFAFLLFSPTIFRIIKTEY